MEQPIAVAKMKDAPATRNCLGAEIRKLLDERQKFILPEYSEKRRRKKVI